MGAKRSISRRAALVAAAAVPWAARHTWAQAYPAEPIRVVVPNAAGGVADLTARWVRGSPSGSASRW